MLGFSMSMRLPALARLHDLEEVDGVLGADGRRHEVLETNQDKIAAVAEADAQATGYVRGADYNGVSMERRQGSALQGVRDERQLNQCQDA